MTNLKSYRIVNRENQINSLIKWISETKSDNDKELMKKDLKTLMSWDCDLIYSSNNTNDYLKFN